MKTLNLTSYGVEEINEFEMREVNGGIVIEVIAVVAAIGGACATVAALGLAAAYYKGYYDAKNSEI